MNGTARYYQRDAKDALECAWWEHRRCVVKKPTGAGKTFFASMVIESALPERSLFLADQDELCDQPLRTFNRVSDIHAALERGKSRASLGADVVIGSSQSLTRKARRERFRPDHFSRIFIDEAHRGTERDIEICDYFETALVCGITATPFRQGLADLSKWYPHVAYRMEPLNFIDLGFAPLEILRAMAVEIDLSGVRIKSGFEGKDYNADDSSSAIEPYFDAICEILKKEAEGRFGIAYLPLIETSKKFAECLRRHGITAMHVDGTMADRPEIIEAFSRKRFSWLTNAGVVSTGVDIPIANAFLCLKPTRSRSWYQQARGRTWRVLPGVIDHLPEKEQAMERQRLIAASDKPDTLIFDLLWQNDELGVCRSGDMYAENEYDARQIFERVKASNSPLVAAEIARQVQEERELAVVRALEGAAVKAGGVRVQADHVGGLLGDTTLANWTPVCAWEMQSLSESQKAALASYGVEPHTVQNKGHAHRIITAIKGRLDMGFASLKQVRVLKEHNSRLPEPLRIQGIEQMSLEDATAAINRFIKRRAA